MINGIKDVSAGSIVYSPGGKLGPRIQNDYQFVLLHSGTMKVIVDDVEFHLLPGQMIVLLPGGREEFYFDLHQPTWHRWITLTLREPHDQWVESMTRHPKVFPLSEAWMQYMNLMETLDVEPATNENLELRLQLGVSAHYLYISECAERNAYSQSHPTIIKAAAFIKKHYSEHIDLNILAGVLHISKGHLVRLFQQEVQTTPMAFVWKYRLERAVDLLRNSGLSMQEIASQTGFKTSYHFSRMVKHEMNNTPTQIRNDRWAGM